MKAKILIPSLLVALLVVACGGSGGGSASTSNSPSSGSEQPQSTQISGTAASGAPLIGSVTVKDALGATKTVTINLDGSYSVDVSGMTAPFVFRAVGTVGGTQVALTSVATSADVGSTINITPFTDLIVANLAGKVASEYFDSPDFALLTPTEVNSARDNLTQRLLPVMRELGVSDGFDLLRTAFKADRTLFDAVMDVVKVTVDSATNTAVIRDLINNTQVQDNLASRTDAETMPAPPSGSYAGAMSALDQITVQVGKLAALFKDGLPHSNDSRLRALFVPNSEFLHGGMDLERFLSPEWMLDELTVGVQITNPVIVEKLSDTAMKVRFSFLMKSGESGNETMVFRKSGDVWLMAGDREHASMNVLAVNSRFWFNSNWNFDRILELGVDTAAPWVEEVVISGAGLPSTGVSLVRSTTEGGPEWTLLGRDGQQQLGTTWVGDCANTSAQSNRPCIDWTQVRAGTKYNVNYYGMVDMAERNEYGSYILEQPPVSNQVAQDNAANWFASFASFSPASTQQFGNDQSITISWTKPSDSAYRVAGAGLSGGGLFLSADVIDQSKTSLMVGTWSGSAPSGEVNTWLGTEGPYDRRFVTGRFYPR